MNSAAFKRGLHDGVPIGLGYFAVSFTFGMMAAAGGGFRTDLTHKPYLRRSVCRNRDYFCVRFIVGDGTDTACDQSEILSDVFFTFPEAGTGYFHGAQASGCFWSYG